MDVEMDGGKVGRGKKEKGKERKTSGDGEKT